MSLYYKLVGLKQRVHYWSNGPVADWIRRVSGVTKKPHAATMEDWEDWRKQNETKIGYWIAEEGLEIVQDIVMFIPDVYRNLKRYTQLRWIEKPHYLDTKLQRGQYHELDTRILHGLFEELVDFVEVEKSQMQQLTESGWKRRPKKRSAKKGLQYLDWEISLSSLDDSAHSEQSKTAQDVKDLYNWWKYERPNRVDPYQASGFSQLSEFPWKDRDQEQVREVLSKLTEIEQKHDDEDTEMLIQLIKIRKGLWT